MTENNAVSIFNLIAPEFAEILLIHFAFFGVNNCYASFQNSVIYLYILNCTDNVAELAYA